MNPKPWREVITPHKDVLSETFEQAEFAVDLKAVHRGSAKREYLDASDFFERTFVTEGMRQLLSQVLRRLAGKGGEPVIQLQTAFGGGKTHTMLAVYHIARYQGALSNLSGLSEVVQEANVKQIPTTRVVVIDGNEYAPNQPWKPKGSPTRVRTLWGELAWQLGQEEGYALVEESDQGSTSPGSQTLYTLLSRYAPCVILLDELVAYIRQFPEGKEMTGGSYESNLSFFQALTEVIKEIPTAILLASLPSSDTEVGGERGKMVLKGLEKLFGRVQALWKPVSSGEAFEIVRRRLFDKLQDEKAREQTCRAFAQMYVEQKEHLPQETQESRYLDALKQAYPIHPEVLRRLYEDWSTLESFQRTRGMLKLMAKVIRRLWQDNNKDLLIMPSSLPLSDKDSANDLVYQLNHHQNADWNPILERDVDGESAEAVVMENQEPRFGEIQALRRITRTIFLGSAPHASLHNQQQKGLGSARILLGCLQPDGKLATPHIFLDGLNRLVDRLHYLNLSGEKGKAGTRYWLDTRANLRREMEERKQRFDDASDLMPVIKKVLEDTLRLSKFFDGIHVFESHKDIPDDSKLRLVVLPMDKSVSKDEKRESIEIMKDYLKQNGNKPRANSNRLLFLCADNQTTNRLRNAVRTMLAWDSIVRDIEGSRLNVDTNQQKQAKQEHQAAKDALPRVASECFVWLFCPEQESPKDSVALEAKKLDSTNDTYQEIERVCVSNEWVIKAWSPVHLHNQLSEFYWAGDRAYVRALSFWEDTQRYIYLPRLKDQKVLEEAITAGVGSKDFFAVARGEDAGLYTGFQFGTGQVQVDETLLLIKPAAAHAYQAKLQQDKESKEEAAKAAVIDPIQSSSATKKPDPKKTTGGGLETVKAREFRLSEEIRAESASMLLSYIAEEVIQILVQDPNASIKVTLEVSAQFPNGVEDGIKRAITENCKTLGLTGAEWE